MPETDPIDEIIAKELCELNSELPNWEAWLIWAAHIRSALFVAGYRIEHDPGALLERGKEDVPSGKVR